MKVLLVKPERSVCEECCCGASAERVLPVQFVHAAHWLRRAGFDITVNDRQVAPPIEPSGFDVVVVWVSMFETFTSEVAVALDAHRAGARTVVILNDPTGLEHEVMERYPAIDYIVRLHERERTLADLLAAIRDNRELSLISGLYIRTPGGIVDTGTRALHDSDLAFIGDTSEELSRLPLSTYDRHVVLAGKGCPHSCAFCQYRSTAVRKRPPDHLVSELRLLAAHGARNVTLQDINFFSKPAWARELLDRLARERLGLTYCIDCRLEALLDTEWLTLMKRARVVHATVGVETLSGAGQQQIDKRIPLARLSEALRGALRHGVMPHASYIVGLQDDTLETLRAIERQVKRGPFALFDVSFVVPSADSPLFDSYRERGLLGPVSLQLFERALTGRPIVKSEQLDADALVAFRTRMYAYARSFRFLVRYVVARGLRANPMGVFAALRNTRRSASGRRL